VGESTATSLPEDADDALTPNAGELLAARLRELVARIRVLDPQVRHGAPTSVHEMRLASRRLRATLGSYQTAFDVDEAEALRGELQWFGSLLGEVRDREVVRARVGELDQESTALLDGLEAEHRHARATLMDAMESPRYEALVALMEAFADRPPFTALAALPARVLVRSGARRDWLRVQERVNTLPPTADEAFGEHLHGVRKAAKRLSYGLETGTPVEGDEAVQLRRRLRLFQRRLGDHHDATLTRLALTGVADTASEPGRRTRLAELTARAEAEAAAIAAEFPRLWRRLSSSDVRSWLG
jgi:CHAD domain-containing protein